MTVEMRTKVLEARDVQTSGLEQEGELVAIASAYGVVDQQGDRVVYGAFATEVEEIANGKVVPLVWGHDINGSPQNFVGQILRAMETEEGLLIRAKFDLEDDVALKARRLVMEGTITKLSIGFRIRPGGERRGADGVPELTDLELREVSLVLSAANEATRVVSVKGTSTVDVPAPLSAPGKMAAPTATSAAELRARAERAGLAIPMTALELRQRSDTEVKANLTVPTRELRRRSDEARLEQALGSNGVAVVADVDLRRKAAHDAIRSGRTKQYMLTLLTPEEGSANGA
jgi:HK97 family phage prohead protease